MIMCSECGNKEATFFQIVTDDSLRREIRFCNACFLKSLSGKFVKYNKKFISNMNRRMEFCEEKVFSDYDFKRYSIDSLFLPQVYFNSIYEKEINEESIVDSVVLTHLNYYRKKLETAIKEKDYELSEKLFSLIEKLNRYFKK